MGCRALPAEILLAGVSVLLGSEHDAHAGSDRTGGSLWRFSTSFSRVGESLRAGEKRVRIESKRRLQSAPRFERALLDSGRGASRSRELDDPAICALGARSRAQALRAAVAGACALSVS
eukprot:357485-Pleurochrysis_carterae.AAC.1